MFHAIKITVLILIGFVTFSKCCDCNLEGIINDTLANSSLPEVGKRQMHSEEFENEIVEEEEIPVDTSVTTKYAKLTDEPSRSDDIDKETSNEINMLKLCKNYKMTPMFDFAKMADVWQIIYYKAMTQLSCFKIHIRKVSDEDRKKLYRKYGDFHHAVDWQKCQFEVASSSDRLDDQKHFIQGTEKERGVFENIILSRDEGSVLSLIDQSPDQWLVIKNLLLMRDCDNGDIVVFSRVPAEATMDDIKDALRIFGEDATGHLACEEQRDLWNLRPTLVSEFPRNPKASNMAGRLVSPGPTSYVQRSTDETKKNVL